MSSLSVPIPAKIRANSAFHTKVMQNYQSACTADIYSLIYADEMVIV